MHRVQTIRTPRLHAGWPRRLLRGAFVLTAAVEVTALGGGLAAFLLAPRLDVLGDGPGGLWGAPMLLLHAAAVLCVPMLLASLVGLVRRAPGAAWGLLASSLPFGTALGFFFVSHAFDPCALGWLTLSSTFLGEPLCQPWTLHNETSGRLHLLHHAVVPTLPLVLLQGWLLRRTERAAWNEPHDRS